MPSHTEAIVVRNATKKYGDNKPTLDGLNMSVARGSIYGLLGASGCGKTTLLSCIVGIRALDSGEVWVLGGNPGSKGSSIPGPRVGFMPQEISLVQEFTVMGAFNYFGRINDLDFSVIIERYEFLSQLLQLPPKNSFIKNLSGGQQRRVSLACALVHEPELLILDEPTVGLDPVLRENIWNFLVTLTQRGVTIIITTHYIDEAKSANKIGLLRHGKLLAEASPDQLLAKCRCDTLEEAFLRLSQKQEDCETSNELQQINADNNTECLPELEEITNATNTTNLTTTISTSTIASADQNLNVQNVDRYNPSASWIKNPEHRSMIRRKNRRFQALLIKNFLQFIRHPGGILFAVVFPLLQVNLFFSAIGHDPQDLTMAIVNHEAGDCYAETYIGDVIYSSDDYTCDFVDLSCSFISSFRDKIGKYAFYNDSNDALDSVKHGDTVGIIYFGKNFSHSLQERLENFHTDDVGSGQIQVRLDMGNRQIGLYLETTLYEQFFDMYSNILRKCNLPKKLANLPLRLEEPVYGSIHESYSTFMAPPFVLTLIFFLATSVSSAIIIADRSEGVWDRSLVQGVTTAEILTSHLITQITVVIIQVTITTTVTFLQYNLECRGSFIATTVLIFLTGVCGLCYGFLVSVMCTSHSVANFIATGSFYPVVLLCGCVWPIEGMPSALRWFSYVMPITIPGLAMRSIINKGYYIDDPQVYQGFIVICLWIICFVGLCFFGLSRNKS